VILFGFVSAAALFYAGGHAAGEAFDPVAGLWMWTKVWLVPFAVWNYLAGITLYLQHIHERIPWKSEADWTAIHGQFFGTVNYHMPAVINFFIHNAYLHMPHHVQIRIPFYHLPRALADIRAVYGDLVQESYTPIRDYLRLIGRCKLFDPDSGRWYTYREAREIPLQAGS
jgi:omega-6 fatty acid desaturase (delta-12 desaturase)